MVYISFCLINFGCLTFISSSIHLLNMTSLPSAKLRVSAFSEPILTSDTFSLCDTTCHTDWVFKMPSIKWNIASSFHINTRLNKQAYIEKKHYTYHTFIQTPNCKGKHKYAVNWYYFTNHCCSLTLCGGGDTNITVGFCTPVQLLLDLSCYKTQGRRSCTADTDTIINLARQGQMQRTGQVGTVC